MPDSAPDEVVVHPATNQDAAPAAATTPAATTDEKPAASSTTETKPATMLDAVKAAIHKPDASPASKTPDDAAQAVSDDSIPTDTDADELSPAELASLSDKTQKRFKKLVSDIKARDATLQGLEPKAAEYDKIDTFIKNAGLSPQDVGSTLEIAAMLRSDPQAARERLRPIMAHLDTLLGEVLPPELQARVDNGYLTEEDAKALNRSSASAKLATQRLDATTEQQRQNAAVEEQKRTTESTLASIETWEATKASKDPEWHLKKDDVAEKVELAIQRKSLELKRPWFPNSEEAVKLSEDALKSVNDRFKKFGTKPVAVQPPVNAGSSTRSTPEPKTMLDVVRAGSSSAG